MATIVVERSATNRQKDKEEEQEREQRLGSVTTWLDKFLDDSDEELAENTAPKKRPLRQSFIDPFSCLSSEDSDLPSCNLLLALM